ncbi:phenylalanine--tRNA ligase subunit alpha [Desulfosudis oleivorans]|uniref:Phenylalanine--tRNA ligase alpha subunit n=1 Tax=Desulfosudis oleivorans (strain DSM 6200 / JCM 39069 / Hxd3) TaxID=96561 RepID=SYFA_DESOH|nr:phenylalanine--tRNA ligase subunit alpha [Desulfosudis oleivorans]A8ZZ70.1 RecName: Full=Phenylalanine--tRNA ligase alpha subunit; AltName: Full=Phenylalanyl-tRNA synthetase alpha subunit; Short=PheRS [Desulfosudis oleivorans Hxd3]ABW68843.1 phenylalanyl-tRNA synthetase, alpha subunit [Desulfosudis oleivorans Hxd3]
MTESLDGIKERALREIASARDTETLQSVSVKYLGRKGAVTLFLRNLSQLPAEERPRAGQAANQVKQDLQAALDRATEQIAADSAAVDGIDVSLPGRPVSRGTLHPITRITRRICEIFGRMGFDVVEGPEIETDYYNFEALNIPKHHPARDMQDTFYISDNVVLRTHTSPTQPRVMEKTAPPLRIIAPGKVYRCDSDVTHTPMFHQVEGLMVDRNVSFGDLKGILTLFIHRMFDPETSLRFRPSYFPFTEPSAEVDIRCVACRGKGCRICSHTGWLEILGAGMVHPAVFEKAGYDTQAYTGFAFGMGVERIAMLKYNIDDTRKFFENDTRFLRQF